LALWWLYPLLELWTLIELGSRSSAVTAVSWVVVTVLLGLALLRWVGRSSVRRLAQARHNGLLMRHLIRPDLAVVFAAILLIVPGLVSDVLAMLTLIKAAWLALINCLAGGQNLRVDPHLGRERESGTVIEGEFETTVSREDAAQTEMPLEQIPIKTNKNNILD
jgi:UPF0716 protein FxsA